MSKQVNPAHMRNRAVESGMGESGFSTEAHARAALRHVGMYGDSDGTAERATKQFPHLAKEHSGARQGSREFQGKEAKTIQEHRREAQGKVLSGGTEPPNSHNESQGAGMSAPESTGQMDGTDVSEDGDENFLDA
jgi:hypothetical protein